MLTMPHKHNTKKRHYIPGAKYTITNWPQYETGLRRRCLSTKGEAHILADSAGQWQKEKHGIRAPRDWHKLHLAVDVDNFSIVSPPDRLTYP